MTRRCPALSSLVAPSSMSEVLTLMQEKRSSEAKNAVPNHDTKLHFSMFLLFSSFSVDRYTLLNDALLLKKTFYRVIRSNGYNPNPTPSPNLIKSGII